jgi:hypothetical protein
MKKIFLLVGFIFILIVVHAQKKFDSTAYVQFYENRWEKFQFDNFTTTHMPASLFQEERIAGLSKCWAEAKYNFANFDLIPNVNWDSLYQSFIPKVIETSSTLQYYKVLQNFYQHLKDGHSSVTMPYQYYKERTGTIPLEVRWIENKVIVTKNTSELKEEQSILPGMELIAFNNTPILQYIKENISPYINFSTPQDSVERIYRFELLPGKAGAEATLSFRTTERKTITQTMKYKAVEKYWEPYPLVIFKVLKGNIGYLQINSFNDNKVISIFDSLFTSIAQTNALLIDIRNNGGGNGSNGFEILGCLTDKPFYQGKTILRHYKPVGRAWGNTEESEILTDDWKPYKNKLYTKPVIVLTSAATYSAAEDFTTVFRSMNRGKIIGATTGGSTGQPITFGLPGGGMARVCAKRDFISDGTEFVGIGIQPDIEVKPTIKGISSNKDEALEAALNYLKQPSIAKAN